MSIIPSLISKVRPLVGVRNALNKSPWGLREHSSEREDVARPVTFADLGLLHRLPESELSRGKHGERSPHRPRGRHCVRTAIPPAQVADGGRDARRGAVRLPRAAAGSLRSPSTGGVPPRAPGGVAGPNLSVELDGVSQATLVFVHGMWLRPATRLSNDGC